MGRHDSASYFWIDVFPSLSRFWFFKFTAATAISIGAFFIPDGAFTTGENTLTLSLPSLGVLVYHPSAALLGNYIV